MYSNIGKINWSARYPRLLDTATVLTRGPYLMLGSFVSALDAAKALCHTPWMLPMLPPTAFRCSKAMSARTQLAVRSNANLLRLPIVLLLTLGFGSLA
ncbi:MAG: hypothetical protein M3Q51_00860, partial [Pseudomonadota bacterium]|nr:hypothetical protein [Pseudomonadota bacterium]